MANVVVAENHLTFGGVRYFRGGAQTVQLLSIGEKKKPLIGQNRLEVKDNILVGKVQAAKSSMIEIDFTSTKKSAFTTAVSAIIEGIPVHLDGGAAFDKMHAHELKLVLLSVTTGDLVSAVNKSPQAKQKLIDWGDDARGVHQAFFVIDAKTASQFGSNTTVNLSAGVKGMEAKVGASSQTSNTSSVVLPAGMCFAYLLAKFDWDAKQKKNVTKAVDADPDQWSFS